VATGDAFVPLTRPNARGNVGALQINPRSPTLKRTARLPLLPAAALSLGSLLATGCGAAGSTSPDEIAPPEPQGAAIGHAHLMLTAEAQAEADLAAEAQDPGLRSAERARRTVLTYFGGPIIQNVAVTPIYWNNSYAFQSTMNAFYSAVVTGTYVSFLQQYNTSSPSQRFGNGTRGTPFVDSQTGTSITDAQIQTYLANLINAHKVPAPTNNTYYPIHFPPGVSINMGGSLSCVQFCAYHGTFVHNGQDVYYGVLPDTGQSGCNGGCGTSTVANNNTSVASHEYAEALTDPAVGIATVFGPPLGWYNRAQGEIGDLCNGQETTATLGDGKAYTVQRLFSNTTHSCVTP
jgi:hypothetical protein